MRETEDVMMKNTKRNMDQAAASFNVSLHRATIEHVVTEQERQIEREICRNRWGKMD